MRYVVSVFVAIFVFFTAVSFAQAKSPQDVYLEYLKVAKTANSLEATFPYMSSKEIAEAKELPPKMAEFSLMMTKSMASGSVKSIEEKIKGDQALLTITIETTSPDGTKTRSMQGEVRMIKENNQWKIDEENWQLPMQR